MNHEYRCYQVKYAEDRFERILVTAPLVDEFEKNPGALIEPGFLDIKCAGDIEIESPDDMPLDDMYRGF